MVGSPLGSVAEGFLLAVSRSVPCSGHDAAGSFGFGAYFQGFWFFGQWVAPQLSQSIANKALFPVVVAARVCGLQWSQKLLSAARYSFSFSSVPGVNNLIADVLSRFYWQEFWHLAPEVQPIPTSIPNQLLLDLTPLPLSLSA